MEKDWKFEPTEPLLILSRLMGDTAPNWAEKEMLNQLSSVITVGSEFAASLQLEHLLPLVEAYGEALFCQFMVGERIVLNVSKSLTQKDLDDFHSIVDDIQQITLDIKINKERLVENWFGDLFRTCSFSNRLFLYLFPGRLESFIAYSNLAQLEKRIWDGHWGERIVFIIPDREVCIVGPHILVIGGNDLKSPPSPVFDNRMKSVEELARVYQKCQETLKWQKPWIVGLTPWHLYVENLHPSSDIISDSLRRHFVDLFLLYTAERTTEKDKGDKAKALISSYTTSQQAIDVGYDAASQLDMSTIPAGNFKSLLHIFEWAYDAQWKANDRLPLVQIGIVEALKGTLFPLRFKLLLENAPTIDENITWHWKAFVEGKIDAYLEQVQNLEEHVSKTVNVYSDQISAIIASLTETMLAAIGVVLGSFVASLFSDQFNPTVFRIGLVTYALYAALFPLLYNMKHRWETIETLEKEFQSQKGRFEKRIPPERVQSIIEESQINQNKERFKRWFWWTVAIYLLAVVVLVLAAIIIPIWIQSSAAQSISSAPMVTPTNFPSTLTP